MEFSVKNFQIFRYILSVIDDFSRFSMLSPLPSKSANAVAIALRDIFFDFGQPDIMQCDNGKEFQGNVKKFLEKKKINVIHGRPYHPQSQGKVERCHRTMKKKLRYFF